jgi:hypothetical protein
LLDVDRLRAGLRETGAMFNRLDVVDETGSTNADLTPGPPRETTSQARIERGVGNRVWSTATPRP